MTVHLVAGDDAALVSAALSDLVHLLVGDNDRSLMVDDFDGDDYLIADVVDAAQTPAFLTERRVVVARGVDRFGGEELNVLLRYLSDPLDTTDLVLVISKAAKKLTDAVKAAGGEVHQTAVSSNRKERGAWVEQQVAAAGLHLDGAALNRLKDWLGEDAGRLSGVLEVLASTYGKSRTLRPADVEPFLGEAGDVPPWDLTDAIDRGDTTTSLLLLHRMMHAGDRHPLQIMAILTGHYGRLLRLDGAEVHDEASAAEVLRIKPGFQVRKAMELYRRLGSGAVHRAVQLLAQADLDLRGHRDWSEELVMEVLVARLSRLGGGADSGRRRR